MKKALATLHNAYAARGVRIGVDFSGNPLDVLVWCLIHRCKVTGEILDIESINDVRAYLDEPVERVSTAGIG